MQIQNQAVDNRYDAAIPSALVCVRVMHRQAKVRANSGDFHTFYWRSGYKAVALFTN